MLAIVLTETAQDSRSIPRSPRKELGELEDAQEERPVAGQQVKDSALVFQHQQERGHL